LPVVLVGPALNEPVGQPAVTAAAEGAIELTVMPLTCSGLEPVFDAVISYVSVSPSLVSAGALLIDSVIADAVAVTLPLPEPEPDAVRYAIAAPATTRTATTLTATAVRFLRILRMRHSSFGSWFCWWSGCSMPTAACPKRSQRIPPAPIDRIPR
jgi:hypothetical protein